MDPAAALGGGSSCFLPFFFSLPVFLSFFTGAAAGKAGCGGAGSEAAIRVSAIDAASSRLKPKWGMRRAVARGSLLMGGVLGGRASRMIVPRTAEGGDEGDDPRAELVRRLQEDERYKKGAEEISRMPRMERDIFPVEAELVDKKTVHVLPELDLKELLVSLKEVLARAEHFDHHLIQREALSVRQRMGELFLTFKGKEFVEFSRLFDPREGRMGVVVTFLALLELVKERLVGLVQAESFGQIHVKSATAETVAKTDPDQQDVDETREQV